MFINYKLNAVIIYVVMAFVSVNCVHAQILLKKGSKYYFELEGVKQNIKEAEFRILISENEKALQLFTQSRNLNRAGNILIFAGIPLTFSGVVSIALSNLYNSSVNVKLNGGLAGGAILTGGLIAFTFGVVNKTNGDKYAQESINLYNNSKILSDQQEKIDVKLFIQPGNVGLYCTF